MVVIRSTVSTLHLKCSSMRYILNDYISIPAICGIEIFVYTSAYHIRRKENYEQIY